MPAVLLAASPLLLSAVVYQHDGPIAFAFFVGVGLFALLCTIHGLPCLERYSVDERALRLAWHSGSRGRVVERRLMLADVVGVSEVLGPSVRKLNWWHRTHWWSRGPFRKESIERVGLLVQFERRPKSRSNFARSSPVAIYVSTEFRDALLHNLELVRAAAEEVR